MKFNFRKISAIATSLLLTGMTAGIAAAANYPAPFVSGSTADVAIVYGTGAGVSALDQAQAQNIEVNLGSKITGGVSTVSGGDSYKFEKTSTKFHLGDGYTTILTTLDEDELPTLLADGTYIDDDNDEFDYTQKIVMDAANTLTMFESSDYKEDVPTVGIHIASGATVLTYTLTFSEEPLISDMPSSTVTFMGKPYYVLSNTTFDAATGSLTLLDSAESAIVTEGSSSTIGGKTVSIAYISSTEVKLIVDGETTSSLGELNTQRLSGGSYVGIKDIMHDSKDGSLSSVEISIGSGKLKLTNAAEVQLNDVAVSGLTTTLTNTSATMRSIALAWVSDDDLFVAEDSEVTMPGFGAVKLSFAGLNYPAEEVIEVKKGATTYATLDNFPLKDGVADIDFLYGDSTSFTNAGKSANDLLHTDADGNFTYDEDTDDYTIVSWSDGSDAESYYVKFSAPTVSGSYNVTDVSYWVDGAWSVKKSAAKSGDSISFGNAEIILGYIDNAEDTIIVSNNSANTNSKTLYTKEGMTVYLPVVNTTAVNITNATLYASSAAACAARAYIRGDLYTGLISYNNSANVSVNGTCLPLTFILQMREEDLNENKYSGDSINITMGWDLSTTPEVEVSSVGTDNTDATSTEIEDTNVWRDFTYSALATEILWDKPDSGQKSIKLIYHGDEVAADVRISSPDAVIIGGTLGNLLVTDSEVSTVSTKNLIIVGGSCINSAAASVLGGAYCGAAFTQATGVGTGEFLIKGVSNSDITSKLALVVAGYEQADTSAATTYLTTQTVDTSKAYKGTSSTSAEVIVA